MIDLLHARLVTHSTGVGDKVLALRLTADAHRLYALASDAGGKSMTLALLDPATLRVVRRSEPVSYEPTAIIAVAQRR